MESETELELQVIVFNEIRNSSHRVNIEKFIPNITFRLSEILFRLF